MKQIIVLFIVLVVGIIVFPSYIFAWDDCPFGLENDPYPGECPRYVDTDGDGICDHSQSAPEDRNEEDVSSLSETSTDHDDAEEGEYSVSITGKEMKTLSIAEIADMWEIDAGELLEAISGLFSLEGEYTESSILDTLREEYPFSPEQIKIIADEIKNGTLESTSSTTESVQSSDSPYNFGVPFFVSVVLYVVMWYLTKTSYAKKYAFLAKPTFNLFWNTVLVVSTIPSVLFGFYLVLRYSYPKMREVEFDFLYWHVEGSIVFGTVAVMHLITRLRQYVAPLRLFR